MRISFWGKNLVATIVGKCPFAEISGFPSWGYSLSETETEE